MISRDGPRTGLNRAKPWENSDQSIVGSYLKLSSIF